MSRLVHNFADDSTSAFTEIILDLIDILQSGSEKVIDWFKNNKMIVNREWNENSQKQLFYDKF